MLLLEEKTDGEKEKLYEDLQVVHHKVPEHDIVKILGELNAKIGKKDV